MRDFRNSTSLKQRLGTSKQKKSIHSRIGNSGSSTGISSSLKNRLSKRQTTLKPSNIKRSLISEHKANVPYIQNKLLFKRAIEESTCPTRTRGSLKTRRSRETEDHPVNFRIANGTIVKGLRSDSILLKKKKSEIVYKSPAKRFPTSKIKSVSRNRLLDDGRVSLSVNRGLTVNIKNEQNNRKRIKEYYMPVRTIDNETIVDDEYMSDDDSIIASSESAFHDNLRAMRMHSYLPPAEPKVKKVSRDLQPMSKLVIVNPNAIPTPLPKQHKQVLDSEVQSEIAALQGKQTTENSGPGSGVRSFKMIPVITTKPLTDRFRQDSD